MRSFPGVWMQESRGGLMHVYVRPRPFLQCHDCQLLSTKGIDSFSITENINCIAAGTTLFIEI
jgi:hypothetical protein